MEQDPHGTAHVWAGLNTGWIRQVRISPRDPLFFLLHANVDRQWARWQWQHDRFGVSADDYSPTGSYPGSTVPDRVRIGHYLEETMWPWNQQQGDPGTPADPGDDRPDSAPGGPFPPATPFILGPPSTPKPRDMIDYLGRQDPTKGLGVCYDDIPFAPSTSSPPRPTPFAAGQLATLLDEAKPLPERIAAAGAAKGASGEQLKKVFELVGKDDADANLRLAAFQAITMPSRKETIEELIKLSKQKSAPLELRRNVANRLHFALNFSRFGHTKRGDILEALRYLIDDTDLMVREIAAASLAGFDDAPTLERLAEGISNPAKEVLPAETALRLLGSTQQPGYYDLFKKCFEDRSNPATRSAAARGLARFPQAVTTLKEVLRGKAESEELRMTVLAALNANDREGFAAYAIDVATDASAPEELRTYALDAMANHVESTQLRDVTPKYNIGTLNTKVRELATTARPGIIRERAWSYLRQCDKDYLNYAPDMIDKESDPELRLRLKDELMRQKSAQTQRRERPKR
jgi:Common central domain of tyrosinase